jgi:hypothetical protein
MSVYARLNKSGRKSWYLDKVLGGRRIHRKVADTKREALAIEAELSTRYRLGQLDIEDLAGRGRGSSHPWRMNTLST